MTTQSKDIQKRIDNLFRGKTGSAFSHFDPENSKEIHKFLSTLTKCTLQEAISQCEAEVVRGKKNPRLVKVVLAIFLTHNKEVQSSKLKVPSLKDHAEFLPVKRVLCNPIVPDTMQGDRILVYWREDYDLNEHHNHWHDVYPHRGVQRIIDRQGELFLYMHSQMVARCNAELLSWDRDVLRPFDYDDVLTEGYTPPPGLILGTYKYTPRPANKGWQDNDSKAKRIQWRDNIYRAIDDGYFETTTADGSPLGRHNLTPDNAMNVVGVVVESEYDELRKVAPGEYIDNEKYGNLHNLGHDAFAKIGSDKGAGVMGDVAVAVRDPVFWLWHRHIDDFRRKIVHKYSHSVDEFKPAAELKIVKIVAQTGSHGDSSEYTQIKTFMGPPQLQHNEVLAKVDHEAYQWNIVIQSTRSPSPTEANYQKVTVRLFIVPEDQQDDPHAWIEMDKFTAKLTTKSTSIIRLDTESTVARKDDSNSTWCKCGWPQSMMLPIGKTEGMPFIAFAMLTEDHLGEPTESHAISFCGAESEHLDGMPRKYPDPRGMGYPFNKTWKELQDNKFPSIMAVVKEKTHMSTSKFKIYRTVKNYEPSDLNRENEKRLDELKEELARGEKVWSGLVSLVPEYLPFQDKIKGFIRVANLAYEKQVTVRWTNDSWKTIQDKDAAFSTTLNKESDLFEFTLPFDETKDIEFAVRYRVGGNEVWDNNGGGNYHVNN